MKYKSTEQCIRCHNTERVTIEVYGDYDGEFSMKKIDPNECSFCKHYAKVLSGEVKFATDEEVEEWRMEW